MNQPSGTTVLQVRFLVQKSSKTIASISSGSKLGGGFTGIMYVGPNVALPGISLTESNFFPNAKGFRITPRNLSETISWMIVSEVI